MIEVGRADLIKSLDEMSRSGSLLVVGSPGTGKSWLLRQFAATRPSDRSVVFILAEEHNVQSLRELEESLGTPAGIITTLASYPKTSNLLIIDSLDSLRSETSQRVFRQLIRQVQRELPNWVVVASIRSFDASESLELQRLFPILEGEAITLNARYLVVMPFTEEEVREATQQDPRLAPLIANGSDALKEILRNAFNLWLVIHLLDGKANLDWLNTIESEIQLFERYWYYRIDARQDSYDRQLILTDITRGMVEGKTLSIPLRDAYSMPGTSTSFRSLLSDEVIRKTSTYRIAYTHNILFDFAVAKLLLDPDKLLDFLRDSHRSIFFRPSVSYFLALLWFGDRDGFWATVSNLFASASALPARLHVLPGITIFNCATSVKDLLPLLELAGDVGVAAILSVLRAVQAFEGMSTRHRDVWLELLYELSSRVDRVYINEYLALVELAARDVRWSQQQKRFLGTAAVRLLTWMWAEAGSEVSKDTAEQLLSLAGGRVIPLVAGFYSPDDEPIRKALETVLQRIGRADVSVREAYSLANSLEPIIDVDPAFAVDIYASIFGHKEKSQRTTQMGGSRVLVLTSTRAQDYQMAYHILQVRFSYLLKASMWHGSLAAVRSVTAEVRREYTRRAKKLGGYATWTRIAGLRSRLLADRSEFWDQGYRDSVSLQILDTFFRAFVEGLRNGELQKNEAWRIFRTIVKENRFPVVWKRLLEHAARDAELLPFAVALLQSAELLSVPETTTAAGDLIKSQFENIDATDRALIEAAIWKIPSLLIIKIYRDPEAQRNRLLACIPENLQSIESKRAVEAARDSETLLGNQPFFRIGTMSAGTITDESWLKSLGADTDSEQNRSLLAFKQPLKGFEGKYLNGIPSSEEIEAILPSLKEGYKAVTTALTADERVVTDVFACVAAVAKSILRNGQLDRGSDAVVLSREITDEASNYPYPEPPEGADRNFDSPAWGSTPKIEAAQGVIHFAYNWGLDTGLANLLRTLSVDKTPAVRFQIASGLGVIYDQNPELFWDIAEARGGGEKSIGVLNALARTVGHAYIGRRDPKRVLDWYKAILKSALSGRRSEDILGVVLDSVTYLYVYVNDSAADRFLHQLERAPIRNARALQLVANSASFYLHYNISGGDSVAQQIRLRARQVELRILSAIDRGFQILEQKSKVGQRGAKKRASIVQHFLSAIENVVFRLYILTNANPQVARPEDKLSNEAEVRAFFDESAQLWDALVSADREYRRPIGPSTANELMECFNRLLTIDPARVLRLTWWLITGRTFGYHFDAMAISEFVKFAEKILADHKDLLQDEMNVVRFAEILDVFVRVGWPEATRIVIQMDAAVR